MIFGKMTPTQYKQRPNMVAKILNCCGGNDINMHILPNSLRSRLFHVESIDFCCSHQLIGPVVVLHVLMYLSAMLGWNANAPDSIVANCNKTIQTNIKRIYLFHKYHIPAMVPLLAEFQHQHQSPVRCLPVH